MDHAPIYPAFGFRVDYAGRSVVISGDTRFSENLISKARGADVIIHEVIADDLLRSHSPANSEVMERVIAHHTTPQQAGQVFTRLAPRLAVFTHIIPVTAGPKELIPAVRQTYSGPLEVGEDLMVINIGEQVTVQRRSV